MDKPVTNVKIGKVIVYYREGLKQGCASMDVQRANAEALVGRAHAKVVKEYIEQETGEYKGARPTLAEAIAECRETGACLVIARLGRLVRNMRVTLDLMNSEIEFLACDNPMVNKATIHILTATAETESRQTSQRTKDTMADLKRKGVKLGSANPKLWKGRERKRGWKKAVAAAADLRESRAKEHYAFLMPEIKKMRDNGGTMAEIVDWMNKQGHLTTAGKPFTQTAIFRLIDRYLGKEYLGRKRPGGRPAGNSSSRDMSRAEVNAKYDALMPTIKAMREQGKTYEEIATTLNDDGRGVVGGVPLNTMRVRRLVELRLGKEYMGWRPAQTAEKVAS